MNYSEIVIVIATIIFITNSNNSSNNNNGFTIIFSLSLLFVSLSIV